MGASTTAARRRARRAIGGLAVTATVGVVMAQAAGGDGSAPAPLLTAQAQGRRLSAADGGPVVQPVRVPAQPQLITAVPARGEVWAVGVSSAPSSVPGFDVEGYNAARQVGTQEVFLHRDAQHGWQSAGAPMENGVAHNPSQITALSVAADGEGWAAGAEPDNPSGHTQVMYHKPAGATTWQVVETPINGSTALSTSVNALSVASDALGTFGVAVLHDGTVETLQSNGTWQPDNTGVDDTVQRVVAVSRNVALAVGGAAAQHFQSVCVDNPQPQACLPSLQQFLLSSATGRDTPDVFVRSAAGWNALRVAVPPHGAAALSLAATATTAWIGGATQGAPWALRLDYNATTGPSGPGATSTSYCAAAAGPCDRDFPEATGALFDMQMIGGEVFAAGGQGLLFHWSGGTWMQEPSSVGPVGAVAFTSARDGWIARLDSFYGIGAAYDPPVLGHYTASPDAPLLRSWPDPRTSRLTAVATDPDGSGAAMAGGDGTILRLDPGSGLWSPMAVPAGLTGPVRAISWPRHDQAWAVAGSAILRFDGGAWRSVPVAGDLGGAALDAIAVATSPILPPGRAATAPPAPTPAAASASAPSQLVAWGDNQDGELGDGSDANHADPVPVAGLHGVVAALGNSGQETQGQAYDYFSVALLCATPTSCSRDGHVEQWGRLLGPARVTRPQPVAGLDGHPIVALSAGGDHVLALDATGTVWAWGDNAYGQLGSGAPGGSSAAPLQVRLPGVVAISAGARHSLAVDSQGTVWCWGDNSAGQCGQSSAVAQLPAPTPVAGVAGAVEVAAGAEFSLARSGGGAVMAWGDDSFDQIGRDSSDPVVALGAGTWVPRAVPGVTATAIAAGEEFGAAVDPAGGVVTWGRNEAGQLGTGSRDGAAVPARVPGLSGVRSLRAAGPHALALTGGGAVYGWGQNLDGEVADTGQQAVRTPLPVTALAGARAIGAGRQSSFALVPQTATGGPLLPSTGTGTAPTLSGPILGYAVGAGGVTVRWDGRSWTVDPQSAALTDQALHAVVLTGRDVVAVGSNGAVLVDDGDGWRRGHLPDAAVDFAVVDGRQRHLAAPDLTAAVALPDGTVLVGGERGTLLQRRGDGPPDSLELAPVAPLEGWVHGLAARRDGSGRLHLAVVVGADPNVEADVTGRPEDTTTLTGAVLVGDAAGWRDAENADAVQDGTAAEQSSRAPRLDDVQAVALDAGGELGWAVGSAGSTWRLALAGTPPPSPMLAAASLDPGPGLSFAFLADTGCLQGICRHQLGWSPRGDVVMSAALLAADSLGRSGQLAFVSLGGDLRQPGGGDRDDLAALRPLFDSLSVPVYAAVGSRDLLNRAASAWEQAYADRPAPWGTGRRPAAVTPVAYLPGAARHAGAATHYAFDLEGGRLRVIVVDTASLPMAAADTGQNPTESQATWLLTTLLDARTRGIPAVVLMNQLAVTTPSTGAGDPGVDAALRAAGAAGVLAAGMPANQLLDSGGVPVGVFGGGGGRFLAAGQAGGDNLPGVDTTHGYWFSWELVTLAPGATAVRIRSIPVLSEVAIDAPAGRSVAAGSAVALAGLGRFPHAAGFQSYGSSDSEFTPATLAFPFPRHCGTVAPGGGAGCSPATVALPDYRFSSDDETGLVPVEEDPARPGHPLHDAAGRAVPDPTGTSGLFCATRPGAHEVTLRAGTVAARLPVEVTAATPGARAECARIAVPAPPPARVAVAAPAPPQPAPPAAPAAVPLLLHEHAPQPPQVGAVAPPPVQPLPAPPGGGGEAAGERQREEEVEAASEDAAMTALHGRTTPDRGALALGAAAAGSVLAGICLGRGARRRRARPAPAWLGTPHTGRKGRW
jgi:alpha-tubulin suppressor-like RCC1 family protein